jgi:hypothetical protein
MATLPVSLKKLHKHKNERMGRTLKRNAPNGPLKRKPM